MKRMVSWTGSRSYLFVLMAWMMACVPLADPQELGCPCVEGNVCDPQTNRCRANTPDVGAADVGVADVGSVEPADGGAEDAEAGLPEAGPQDVGPRDSEPQDVGGVPCSQCTEGQACLDGACVRYVDLNLIWNTACGVMERGKVACWGYRLGGEPRIVAGVEDAEKTVMGVDEICALRRGGAVSCWPIPQEQQAGALSAHPVAFDGPVHSLRTGLGYTCALLEDQRIQCVGDNSSEQFGTQGPSTLTATTVVHEPPLDNPVALFGQHQYTCVAHGVTGSYVTCFGPGVRGGRIPAERLGRFVTADAYGERVLADLRIYYFNSDTGQFAESGNGRGVTQLSAGCRRFESGSLDCRHPFDRDASYPDLDMFGVPSTDSRDFAVATSSVVSGFLGATQVCYLSEDGVIRCLGHNQFGETGIGEPRPLVGRHEVPNVGQQPRQIFGGRVSACAIDGGALRCWGQNRESVGHLGRYGGSLSARAVNLGGQSPLDVALFGTDDILNRSLAVLVETGTTTAVMVYGPVPLEGVPAFDNPLTARPVVALRGATFIEAGYDELCGRLSNGNVRCIGFGTLDLPALLGATDLAVEHEGRYRLAVVAGSVVCSPRRGRCPANLTGLTGVVEVAAGNDFGLARLQDGTVVYFGDDAVLGANTPTPVFGVSAASSISAFARHACAVEAGGATHCWGDNQDEQVEFESSTQQYTPASPALLSTAFTSITTGERFTCGVRASDARLECWGRNYQCELGTCPGYLYETPTPIAAPVY